MAFILLCTLFLSFHHAWKTCLICCQSFRMRLKRAPWITWCSVCRRLRSGPTWTWRRSDTRHRSAAPSPGERSTVGVYTPRWPVSPSGTHSNWKQAKGKRWWAMMVLSGSTVPTAFQQTAQPLIIWDLFFFFLQLSFWTLLMPRPSVYKKTVKRQTWHWLDR